MRKYDLRKIMLKAWALFRKLEITFSEALHRAWVSAKAEPVNQSRIEAAKAAAGIVEDVNTWAGWKALGYEVIHGSKALFGCDLIHASKGDGATYSRCSIRKRPLQAARYLQGPPQRGNEMEFQQANYTPCVNN